MILPSNITITGANGTCVHVHVHVVTCTDNHNHFSCSPLTPQAYLKHWPPQTKQDGGDGGSECLSLRG